MLYLSTITKKIRLPSPATIGRSPSSTVVIDLPSILPTHVELNTDTMNLLPSGPDVYINDELMPQDVLAPFKVNDRLKIKSVEFHITDEEGCHGSSDVVKIEGEPIKATNNVIKIEEAAIDRNETDDYNVVGKTFMDTPSLDKTGDVELKILGDGDEDTITASEVLITPIYEEVTPLYNDSPLQTKTEQVIINQTTVHEEIIEINDPQMASEVINEIKESMKNEEAPKKSKRGRKKKEVIESEDVPKKSKRKSAVQADKKKSKKKNK